MHHKEKEDFFILAAQSSLNYIYNVLLHRRTLQR